jgi:glycosyltransferase involved in cell wall biosynthesis
VKILQVHNEYLQVGGEDAVVRAEADLLEAAGHEVVRWHIANPTRPLDQVATLIAAPYNPRRAAEAKRLGAGARPDVAHVHNTWYALTPSILPALHSLAVPVVMTLHNFRLTCANALLQRDGEPCELCVGSHPWHGVRYKCYRDSYFASGLAAATIALNRRRRTWSDNVDRFIVLSEFAKSRLVAGGVPEEKVVTKPNFVDDPGERKAPPSASDFVLFAGRLIEGKGILTLLDAWSLTSSKLRLVIAGDGPLREQIAAAAPGDVELLGWVEPIEIRRLMLEAKALMFPSEYYENMPMSIIEAYACGLPVVASNRGSTTEIVAPLGERWLVPPGRPERWAEAVSMLADSEEVDEAGKRARAEYESRYSPERGLANLLTAYAL